MTATTAIDTLTYRDDPTLKAGLVAEAEAHRAADRLVQGEYYSNGTSEWRGCAVGCTVAGRLTKDQLAARGFDWHEKWAEVTGLPQWLGHLEDRIFEGLPIETARGWPVRLLSAVPVGVDLTAAREAWFRDIVLDREMGAVGHAAKAMDSIKRPDLAKRLRAIPPDAPWAEVWKTCREVRAAADAAAAAASRRLQWTWMADRLIHHLEAAR
jgi:hypothetical protein